MIAGFEKYYEKDVCLSLSMIIRVRMDAQNVIINPIAIKLPISSIK